MEMDMQNRESLDPGYPDDSKGVHGGDIYRNPGCLDFSANINPLSMPPAVREAAAAGIEASVHYPDVFCTKLVQAIAAKEGVREDCIICGSGAADLIFALCLALKPGKALLTAPTFAEYEKALRCVGCEPEYYVLKEERGFQIGEDILERLKPSTEIFFLCNPNNPTGVLIPPPLLERIVKQCSDAGILLVSDECFLEFLGEWERYSLKRFLGQAGIFVLKAFTKLYAMPGLRLGYGICTDTELLQKMHSCSQPWNVSVPAQYAGLAALREEEYVRRTREYLKQEKEYLLNGFQKLWIPVYGAAANYIFFRAGAGLYEQLRIRGILIRDCSNYKGLGAGYYRIAVRTHEENERLMKALREVYPEGLTGGSHTSGSARREMEER